MNQPLFQQFAEIVKAGKCDAFEFEQHPTNIRHFTLFRPTGDLTLAVIRGDSVEIMHPEIICHHIREWLTGQGWYWELTDRSLTIAKETLCIHKPNTPRFSEGTQLDWHLQAVVDICAGKEAGS